MKSIKSLLSLAFLCIAMLCNAQAPQEITLTVTGEGSSQEEAIKSALRSAIEQSYGAFVSANTTILNDDVVKDEIVTISNGVVKSYKIISAVQSPQSYRTIINATLSMPELVKYAQSHGSECEFAGATFGMQMKLDEINRQNEAKAIENVLYEVTHMLSQNATISVGEPKVISKTGETVDRLPSKFVADVMKFTLNDKMEDIVVNDYYEIPIAIEISEEGINMAAKHLATFLKNIALSKEEYLRLRRAGMECGSTWPDNFYRNPKEGFVGEVVFRNNYRHHYEWKQMIYDAVYNSFNKVVIKDNLGEYSPIYPQATKEFPDKNEYPTEYKFNDNGIGRYVAYSPTPEFENRYKDLLKKYPRIIGYTKFFGQMKSGILKYGFTHRYSEGRFTYMEKNGEGYGGHNEYSKPRIELSVLVPKSEISKYSNFSLGWLR